MKNKNSRVEILRHFDRLPTFTRRDVNLFDRSGFGSLLTCIINHSRNQRYLNVALVESEEGQYAEDLIAQIEQWQTYNLEIEIIRDGMLGISTVWHSGALSMKAMVAIPPSFIAKGLDLLIDQLATEHRAIERIEEERKKTARCRGKLFQMDLD